MHLLLELEEIFLVSSWLIFDGLVFLLVIWLIFLNLTPLFLYLDNHLVCNLFSFSSKELHHPMKMMSTYDMRVSITYCLRNHNSITLCFLSLEFILIKLSCASAFLAFLSILCSFLLNFGGIIVHFMHVVLSLPFKKSERYLIYNI